MSSPNRNSSTIARDLVAQFGEQHRRFAKVTSTDYVPALLEKGRDRAYGGPEGQTSVSTMEVSPCDILRAVVTSPYSPLTRRLEPAQQLPAYRREKS